MKSVSFVLFLVLLPKCSITQNVENTISLNLKYSDHFVNFREVSNEKQAENITSQEHNLNGRAGGGYYVALNIGTPPQNFNVLIDTGSSNFAIAGKYDSSISHYFNGKNSTTFKNLGDIITVKYTQGEWIGVLGSDKTSLPQVNNVNCTAKVALIQESSEFFIGHPNWQGILGLAYAQLAVPDSSVTPFFDSLIAENPGLDDVFTVHLCGVRKQNATSGTMTIGGIDKKLFNGDIHYVPIKRKAYYEIVIGDIKVNGTSLGLDCKEYNFDKTIVDTGTTDLKFPKRVFNLVLRQLRDTTKSYRVLDAQLSDAFWFSSYKFCSYILELEKFFPPIELELIKNSTYSIKLIINPNIYLDKEVLESKENCYKFSISESKRGAVIGAVAMAGFYTVFDRKNDRIGFAPTNCHNIKNNEDTVTGPHKFNGDAERCYYKKVNPEREKKFIIVAYVFAGFAILVLILMIPAFMILHPLRRKASHDGNSLIKN